MKNTFLIASLIVACTFKMHSQMNYSISWGTTDYDTLGEDYTSIMYDILPNPSIFGEELEIDFGFSFPFFDSLYNSVTLDGAGVGYFQDSDDYSLYLFAGDYESHVFSGLPIFSDWRFKSDTVDGMAVLKVEWRNVGIDDDVSGSQPSDHRINFQVWFFENGIIELRFGETDLANSPYYSETDGFIWDDGESYGPWIGILNHDASEVYYITGTNDHISVITEDDDADIFYSIPPYGWYFRFTPDDISGLIENSFESNEFSIYPNPVLNEFRIGKDKGAYNRVPNMLVQVFDATGKLVQAQHVKNSEAINISEIPQGTYFVKITSGTLKSIIKEIIKN